MWIRKDPASRWLAVWNWRSICATGRRCASDTAARRRPAPIRPSALTRKSSPSVRWIAPPSNAVARSASPSTLMIAVSMTTRSAPNSMTILLVRSITPPPPSHPPSLAQVDPEWIWFDLCRFPAEEKDSGTEELQRQFQWPHQVRGAQKVVCT